MTDLDSDAGGGLFALNITDGAIVWKAPPGKACAGREHCSPAQLAPVTAIEGAIFSGSLDGHIRAYSAHSGAALWDADTERDFTPVNGVPGHGGSINGAGPVVAGGFVYVSSGYSRFGEMCSWRSPALSDWWYANCVSATFYSSADLLFHRRRRLNEWQVSARRQTKLNGRL